jgi:hypothetical protein
MVSASTPPAKGEEPSGLVPAEALVEPELIAAVPPQLVDAQLVAERGLLRRLLGTAGWLLVSAAGLVSLVVGLAMLATVPVVNLLSLGYLLEASGRIGRTGQLRQGLIGLPTAAAAGSLVALLWLSQWPLVFIREMWATALLIDPASPAVKGWALGWTGSVLMLASLFVGLGALLAWRRPGVFVAARDLVWKLTTQRLPYYFWLGVRGFVGGAIWLIVPVSVLALASSLPPGPGAALSFLGGLMLAVVVVYLPFLQTHFAVQNRFRAMFELRTVRQMFRRAPVAFWLALVATLLFALPLYLLMIELLPHEVTWLPAVLFVVFLLPARLLCGWAYARAARRQQPRVWLFRWLARLAMIPAAATYAFVVWLSQYLLWYGVGSLYHQHAFLVPVPFLGG